jgi:hypothetical protein
MSGFIFDAKAARAAIAAREPNVAAAAVSAVVAVGGGTMARKPQEPQQPHGKPFRTAIAQLQEPQQPQGASDPTGAAPADEIEERVALAADCVPTVYLDAWARLQCQRPLTVLEHDWRHAVNDAGLFLDEWGREAAEWRWSAGELFDVPRDGKPGGLVWFLGGESVQAIGPRRMVTQDGRVFNRFEN